MRDIFTKTFGGLSTSYYFRQLFFGVIVAIIFLLPMFGGSGSFAQNLPLVAITVVSTLLYPYSRFVYENISNFILGDNLFFVNIVVLFLLKALTILICWAMAIFIAPIGLIYLYYHHSKNTQQ